MNHTIDVRLEFKDDEVSQTTPVALIIIATDISDEKLLMQVNENQIDMIIEELSIVKNQLSVASKLAVK